jgi:multidrug efflux pump
MLNATVTAQSRLQTPEQFRNIIVKADQRRARAAGDVARVELGADNYSARPVNGNPARASASSSPGADALRRPTWSRRASTQIATRIPAGYQYAYANDTTTSSSCRSRRW